MSKPYDMVYKEVFQKYQLPENLLDELKHERVEQLVKWNDQKNEPVDWLLILTRQFGDVSTLALNERHSEDNVKEQLHHKMLTIAAVAFAYLENEQLLDQVTK